jgi:hypothetical protein
LDIAMAHADENGKYVVKLENLRRKHFVTVTAARIAKVVYFIATLQCNKKQYELLDLELRKL